MICASYRLSQSTACQLDGIFAFCSLVVVLVETKSVPEAAWDFILCTIVMVVQCLPLEETSCLSTALIFSNIFTLFQTVDVYFSETASPQAEEWQEFFKPAVVDVICPVFLRVLRKSSKRYLSNCAHHQKTLCHCSNFRLPSREDGTLRACVSLFPLQYLHQTLPCLGNVFEITRFDSSNLFKSVLPSDVCIFSGRKVRRLCSFLAESKIVQCSIGLYTYFLTYSKELCCIALIPSTYFATFVLSTIYSESCLSKLNVRFHCMSYCAG